MSPTYEDLTTRAWGEWVVCHLDVLGTGARFEASDARQRARAGGDLKQFLNELRQNVNQWFTSFSNASGVESSLAGEERRVYEEFRSCGMRISGFSDLIQIASPFDKQHPGAYRNLLGTLAGISLIVLWCLGKRHPLRGGIEIGEGIWDSNNVLGPASLVAYHLESRVAGHPRIVVGPMLVKTVQEQANEPGDELALRVRRNTARQCCDLIANDVADGAPHLDYLGNGLARVVDVPGSSVPLDLFRREAQSFAKAEHERFKREGPQKVAARYRLLLDYFESKREE